MKFIPESLYLLVKFKPYKIAILFAAIILILIYVICFFFILPFSDTSAIQIGYSIIAQILGVLLGALVVLIILLIDQKQQSEKHLISEYYYYKNKMLQNIELIENVKKELYRYLKSGNIKMEEHLVFPDREYSKKKFKDIYINLTSLLLFLKPEISDELIKEFKEFNISEDVQDEILYVKGLLPEYESPIFFKLIEDGLDITFLSLYCSNEISDFAIKFFQEFSQKGISDSIKIYESSNNTLKSKILAVDLFLIIVAISGSVFSIFGLTTQFTKLPLFKYSLYSIITLFFLSLFFSLLLMEKILRRK